MCFNKDSVKNGFQFSAREEGNHVQRVFNWINKKCGMPDDKTELKNWTLFASINRSPGIL